jgi:hypothetical protein
MSFYYADPRSFSMQPYTQLAMVGINCAGYAYPNLDIFDCLALDPHTSPIQSFESLCKRQKRVSTKLHPDKLHGHPLPKGVKYSELNSLITALKKDPARQNTAIHLINRNGRKGWVSTWSDTDIPGSWKPLESYTARLARPSSAPKPSSAHQPSAHKPAYAANMTHPTQQSPTTPSRPRTTQYTFRGNDKKFNTTRRYATTPTGSASRPTPRPAQHSPTTPARSGTSQYSFKDNGERFRTTWGHAATPVGARHKTQSRPRPPDQRNKPNRKRTHPIYIIDSDDDIICEIDEAEFRRIKRGRY